MSVNKQKLKKWVKRRIKFYDRYLSTCCIEEKKIYKNLLKKINAGDFDQEVSES